MVEQQKLREYGASFRGHVWTIGPLEAKPWRIQRGERMDVVAVQSCPMPGSGKPLGKCTLEAMPIYTHRWPMSQRTEEIVRYFYEGVCLASSSGPAGMMLSHSWRKLPELCVAALWKSKHGCKWYSITWYLIIAHSCFSFFPDVVYDYDIQPFQFCRTHFALRAPRAPRFLCFIALFWTCACHEVCGGGWQGPVRAPVGLAPCSAARCIRQKPPAGKWLVESKHLTKQYTNHLGRFRAV